MLEEVGVFYRGLVLGVVISAPVGPIGLMCIRRTIHKGFFIGFATGMGAALADTFFSTIAALGVTSILEFMQHYSSYIRIVGGCFMLFCAWHTWHDKPDMPHELRPLAKKMVGKVMGLSKDESWSGLLKAFFSGIVITLTNPVTIFAVLAVVATFGSLKSRIETGTIVAGIFFGAAIWWFALSGGISLLRGHFTEGRIIIINRVTAVILAALAVWAVTGGVHLMVSPKT